MILLFKEKHRERERDKKVFFGAIECKKDLKMRRFVEAKKSGVGIKVDIRTVHSPPHAAEVLSLTCLTLRSVFRLNCMVHSAGTYRTMEPTQ